MVVVVVVVVVVAVVGVVVVVVVVVEAPDQGRRQHVGGLPAAARAAEAAVRLASQLGVVPHAPRRQPQGRARGKRACGGSGLAAPLTSGLQPQLSGLQHNTAFSCSLT